MRKKVITDIDDYVLMARALRSKLGLKRERALKVVNRVSHGLFLFILSEKLVSG